MKLTNLDKVKIFVNKHKQSSKSIVLATGVFDVLHQEHNNFLSLAKQAGDILIVGLETDSRVKAIKGSNRPINNQNQRLENMSQTKSADLAFLLPEKFDQQQDWENFISYLRPNIYAVSSHTKWLENKRKITEKFGGKLKIVHQHNPKLSTTKIIKNQN